MKETWTDIPGLEGKYQISNMGRYKRLSRYIQGRRLPEEVLPLNQSQVREVKSRKGLEEGNMYMILLTAWGFPERPSARLNWEGATHGRSRI